MAFLISLLVNGLIVYLGAQLLGGVYVESYGYAVLAALILSLVNALVRPLLTILTLPITLLTLGLFLLVVNGLSVLIASALAPGFTVDGLGWAILFSLILTLANLIIGETITPRPPRRQ